MATTSMVAIGDRLRQAREKKSLTIDQVQKQTRIHSAVLAALEDGRANEMLNSTYVKSFLKKYSTFLGLDAEEMAKEYSSARQDKPADVVLTLDRTDGESGRDIARLIRMAAIALVAILVIILALFIGRKMVSVIAKLGRRHGAVTVEAKASANRVTSKRRAESKDIVARDIPLSLVIKAKQQVYVKVKKDGVKKFERVLMKGTVETVKADDKISLYLGKAEAVDLTLNGRSMGSPGRGVIRDLEITRKGIRIK